MYIRGKRERGDISYYRPAEQEETFYHETVCELPSRYLLLLPLLTGRPDKTKWVNTVGKSFCHWLKYWSKL